MFGAPKSNFSKSFKIIQGGGRGASFGGEGSLREAADLGPVREFSVHLGLVPLRFRLPALDLTS